MKVSVKYFLVFFIILASCGQKGKKDDRSSEQTQEKEIISHGEDTKDESNNLQVIFSENKEAILEYYQLPHIKEFYDWKRITYSPPPELTYTEDLSSLSYGDLRLLRNEVFARNGYLFKDGFLRGYFNRYDWYMPVFDVDTFSVILNKKEQELVNKIIAEETSRKSQLTMSKGDLNLYNADLLVNAKQYTGIPDVVMNDLKEQNFSILNANRSMPFFVYDENAYQHIPHYITTDLYLFILHRYFSRFLEKLDEGFLHERLLTILRDLSINLSKMEHEDSSEQFSEYIQWAQMYNSLALFAVGETNVSAPEKYNMIFQREKIRIKEQSGNPLFIENALVNYGELKPRGHYTKSDTLENYFRGFKWISQNGIDLDNDMQIRGMILIAHAIKNDPNLAKNFHEYVSIIERLAGVEDNLSITDIVNLLSADNIQEALSANHVSKIRRGLEALEKERIFKVFGESFAVAERDIKRVFFLSSTYSLDGEIFSRLVHVDDLKSKRPFPRGLDLPAVFGNQTAEDIILNEYQDHISWPEYLSKLTEIQEQFKSFDDWDHNYGFKATQIALAATHQKENYPDFMKTDVYNRKELSTTLSSWTHVKHDLILYQEKPFAAQAGQGGGPEPPRYICYVEPNLEFWDKSLELVEWLENLSAFQPVFQSHLRRIKNLGISLRTMAYKQIEGKEITDEEFRSLHFVGGTIEHILLALLETDHLPERERSMGLIADVYVYNGKNLNVAVGHADDIYVLVPIQNEYYLARGAVFSYYEFVGPIFNDDEWRNMLKNRKIPERPQWLQPIIRNADPLEGQMQFRYVRGW